MRDDTSDTRIDTTSDTTSDTRTRSAATDDTSDARSDTLSDWSILDQISSELTFIYDYYKNEFDLEGNYSVIETIYLIMNSDNVKLKNKVEMLVKEEMSDIVWCYWRNHIKYALNPPEYDFDIEIKKKEDEFWSKLSELFVTC